MVRTDLSWASSSWPKSHGIEEVNLMKSQTKQAPSNQSIFHVVEPRKDYAEMTDTELVVACQRQDSVALRHLLKRYERTILMMIHRRAPEWVDPSDLVQEVFITIWRSIGQLRNPASFKPWVNQIVTNLFYDELRRRPRDIQIISMDEPISTDSGSEVPTRDIADSSPQPEDTALSNELIDQLAKALTGISKPFRQAAVLRDVEGLSYEEIAKVTNTELGTVKSRIARARVKIQERLNPYLCA